MIALDINLAIAQLLVVGADASNPRRAPPFRIRSYLPTIAVQAESMHPASDVATPALASSARAIG
jgi:hypothetical protein